MGETIRTDTEAGMSFFATKMKKQYKNICVICNNVCFLGLHICYLLHNHGIGLLLHSFHVLAMNNDTARIDFHRHRVSTCDDELLCREDQEMAVSHEIFAD